MTTGGRKRRRRRSRRPEALTVADLLHDEPVEADLVDALVQAVGLVDVQHLVVQTLQLAVAQLGTQDLIVKLLWRKQPSLVFKFPASKCPRRLR